MCGPEAQKAADWLFTTNTRRPIGRTVYTCVLNTKGGVEADVTVSAIETGTGGLADPIFKVRFILEYLLVSPLLWHRGRITALHAVVSGLIPAGWIDANPAS